MKKRERSLKDSIEEHMAQVGSTEISQYVDWLISADLKKTGKTRPTQATLEEKAAMLKAAIGTFLTDQVPYGRELDAAIVLCRYLEGGRFAGKPIQLLRNFYPEL